MDFPTHVKKKFSPVYGQVFSYSEVIRPICFGKQLKLILDI